MKNTPKTITQLFIFFFRPHWKMTLALAFTGLLYGIITTSATYMIKIMVDIISNENFTIADIIKLIKLPAIIYVCILLVETINYRVADIIKLILFPAIRKDITTYSFSHLSKQTYTYFQNHFAGSISNRINDLNSSVISISYKLDEAFATTVKLAIATTILCSVHYAYGIILVFWSVILIIVSSLFTDHIIKLSTDYSRSKSKLLGIIVDNFVNIINVLSFANRRYEKQLTKKALDNTVDKDRQMQWEVLVMRIWQDVTFILMIAAMLATSIYLFNKEKITVGDFVLVISLSSSVAQNLWWFVNQLSQLSEDVGKCAQAMAIINVPIDIKDKPNAEDLMVKKGKIEFDNVTFSYHKKRNLFENKQVTIKPGQKIGLVGFTGSGKSSFINLIMRFFEPTSGRILIDDQDIANVRLESLRKQIAMIPQDTSLFHRTIMENIRYGNIDASDEQVIAASKRAFCDEFIQEMPEKYETYVGERGVKLSGGQRQRIAIARAFLKKAQIIIMDEATSALDSITEKKIQRSLNELMKNKTTIVIAHRLSTLADMDRILVFDKGKIVQDGSHSKLIKQPGHYKNLWKMQADGFLPEQLDSKLPSSSDN